MDDYKFCMSIKFMEPEEKYEAWIQRRALWWAKRRMAKSSEDVWTMREYVYYTSSALHNSRSYLGNL